MHYQPGLEKYKLFLQAIEQGIGWAEDEQQAELLALCETLFLQQHRDKTIFRQIFKDAVAAEKKVVTNYYSVAEQKTEQPEQQPAEAERPKPPTDKPNPRPQQPNEQQPEQTPQSNPADRSAMEELPVALSLGDTQQLEQQVTDLRANYGKRFLFSDDYQPLTSRELAQSWRYLRFKEADKASEKLDVLATVQKLAQDGFFSEPVYEPIFKNAKGALVILADYHGSMVAFHSLVQQIIQAAKTEGGHPDAAVYYFRNVPGEHLYRQTNWLDGVEQRMLLNTLQQQRSSVLLISDAGAARGNTNPERIKATWRFLERLRRTKALVSWLNPMPQHRWADTSAAYIAYRVPMFPVLEAGRYGFDKAVKALMGQGH